ncbi:MAG: restriction endonuclease subunit S [Alphaproteobacteria bacterium]
MTDVNQLITEHLDIWTSATEKKSIAGRGNGGAVSLYGIKKLRELILELAVRGKLVSQDDRDEPADALLDRLYNRQASMFAKGLIKKPKPVAKISKDETPFELPAGWEWCRISQLGHDWGQKTPDGEFTYIDVGSIDKELGSVSEPTVLEESNAPSRARKLVRQGTVMYSTVRPYLLNIAVVTEDFDPEPIASTAFAIVHPFEGVSASYLYRYLRSPTFISYVEGCQTGIAYPAINDKQFFSGLVPLPPSAEQHRIVAKVDELMRRCDALETQAKDSLKAHQTLVETCLATLTNSQTTDDLIQNWSRIEAHFDTLFTTEESIAVLRNAMLDLALRGLLTEQSNDGEPASVLLSELYRKNKKSASSRHRTVVSKIKETQAPFDLPKSWSWSNLGLLSSDLRYGTSKKCDRDASLVPVLRIPNVSGGKVDLDDMKFGPLDQTEVADLGLRANDLLIIRSNGSLDIVGSFAVVPELEGDFAFAGYLVRVRIDTGYVIPRYIWYVSRSRFLRDQIERPIRHGVGLKNLNSTELASLTFPIPPKAEQERIIRKLDSLFELCDQFSQRVVVLNSVNVTLANTFASKIH